jgi:hypothetical protein
MENKMMKHIILYLAIIILNLLFLGCIEEDINKEQNIISWELIDCDKNTESFLFNWTDNNSGENYSKITSGISNVSLTIKNTGNVQLSILVDFEFILSEILKNKDTELNTITSNKCPCDYISHSNNSKYYSKSVELNPGEIKTIYSDIELTKFYGFKVTKWCYEINII